ncbi:DUF3017 domain-containing protein [Lapillicoccus jejuensis]|uniref:DUF3017 family protein n=1 Tax=Lapillicoccus jejuensis TaxID=402171 RepID=A0A542E224_9MICO|nr:DUF3017 domain-containing protein [Lapillicoccus jejuensis]TQJ09387.1 DUF3017 family protein [Lapillicoccus jejuensis]
MTASGGGGRWRALSGLGPWWLVALGLLAGLVLVLVGPVRQGGYVVAGSVALGAVLRAVLPSPRGGGLEVRSRGTDVVLLLLVAAALVTAFTLVKLDVPPGG